MGKTMAIIYIVIYDFIILTIATALGLSTSDIVSTDLPTNVGISLSFLQGTVQTFGDLMTFNVEGLPVMLTIIFVYAPNLVLLLILIKLIFNRD